MDHMLVASALFVVGAYDKARLLLIEEDDRGKTIGKVPVVEIPSHRILYLLRIKGEQDPGIEIEIDDGTAVHPVFVLSLELIVIQKQKVQLPVLEKPIDEFLVPELVVVLFDKLQLRIVMFYEVPLGPQDQTLVIGPHQQISPTAIGLDVHQVGIT